jgi:hypothetical protein
MKKVSLVLVFCFFISGCAQYYDGRVAEVSNKIFLGQTKNDFCMRNRAGLFPLDESVCHFALGNANNPAIYHYDGDNEILATGDGRFYHFANVSIPITVRRFGNGSLVGAYNSINEAKNVINANYNQKVPDNLARYKEQCLNIGFKKDTEKLGYCVIELKQAEAKIAALNSQQRASDSQDVLNNILLLNESLKLMNPPRRNFNCQARPFGIYTNIQCN